MIIDTDLLTPELVRSLLFVRLLWEWRSMKEISTLVKSRNSSSDYDGVIEEIECLSCVMVTVAISSRLLK